MEERWEIISAKGGLDEGNLGGGGEHGAKAATWDGQQDKVGYITYPLMHVGF